MTFFTQPCAKGTQQSRVEAITRDDVLLMEGGLMIAPTPQENYLMSAYQQTKREQRMKMERIMLFQMMVTIQHQYQVRQIGIQHLLTKI